MDKTAQTDSKAREKRWVFRRDLKVWKVGDNLTWGGGRSFQSLGAAAEKARSPLVFVLVFGTTSRSSSADLKALEGGYTCRRSEMY